MAGGRTRQLFHVETGRKTERDRKQQRSTTNALASSTSNINPNANNNVVAKSGENAQSKETAKKGAWAAAVIGASTKEKDKEKDHPEKKRAKGDKDRKRGPPALDPTISMATAVDVSTEMIEDEEEEEVAVPGIFTAVDQDKKSGQLQAQQAIPGAAASEPFSFFAFDAGNKNDGLWSYSLEEEDAADMSFDQLNQSIAEATADHHQPQSSAQFLSANASRNQFHANNGLFSSHANSEPRLNDLVDNGDDDFEDEVVFRPVFPRGRATADQQASPFLLSRHATPSAQRSTPEHDLFGAIGTTADAGGLASFGNANNASSNNIWSKFGVGLGMNVEAAQPVQVTFHRLMIFFYQCNSFSFSQR